MQNFWDIIWIVIVSFVFVAYLMVFFRILVDLSATMISAVGSRQSGSSR